MDSKHLGTIPVESAPVFSETEIDSMTGQAKSVLPSRVQFWATRMGLHYQKITVRHQRSRWGSCSSKGNLSFNCLLMQVPEGVLDYVIVHELCHLKQMNHFAKFWAEVESVLPDYRQRRQWLKDHGADLIRRLPNRRSELGCDGR